MTRLMQQLLLTGSQIKSSASFSNFYAGPNQFIVDFLQQFLRLPMGRYLYLWGSEGSGRSHLLQALLQQAHLQNLTSIYIPLQHYSVLNPEVLENIEQYKLVGIDDVDSIAQNPVWEEVLFDTFNRLEEAGQYLIVVSNKSAQELPLKLADLRSRLAAGLSFHIQLLNDEQKQHALKFAACQRGFELPDSVAHYLLTHYGRQQGKLFQLLEKLDQASLVAKRKLTIPFVKLILED